MPAPNATCCCRMTCIVFAAVEVKCVVLADMSLLIFSKM